MINNDKYGLSRFLQATPYAEHDYFSFQGIIDEDLFHEHLYYEDDNAEEVKKELYKTMKTESGKNTFFILGYQGCGKTTFINAVLRHYCIHADMEINDDFLIDCDKYGTDGEKEQLKIIFIKKIIKYITNHPDIIYNYIDFFKANNKSIIQCVNSNKLYSLWEFFCSFIKNKKNINNPKDLNEIEEFLSSFSLRDALYSIVFLFLANKYQSDCLDKDVFIIFVDNLDCVDDYEQLGLFMDAIKALTTDMDKIFNHLYLNCKHSQESNYRFTEKIKILIAMRETTRANMSNSHGVDFFDSIHTYVDITELYNKDNIVDWRLNSITDSQSLSAEKISEINLIKEITKDKYTHDVIVPLYNNNYRRTTKVITKIIIDNPEELKDYQYLMKSNSTYLRHGARGILFKFILDLFNNSSPTEKNLFKEIGVIDLNERKKNYEASICRILLSYLSQKTDTLCSNAEQGISLQSIIDDFDGLYTSEQIINSLLSMYMLKDSVWTHLVSFVKLDTTESVSSMVEKQDFSSINPKSTIIHYSCAGKIYLEVVTTHFEFFSTRIFGTKYPALFCESNYMNGSTVYNLIISKVLSEVKKCCKALKTHNKKIIKVKGLEDSAYTEINYLKSPFIATIKKINTESGEYQKHKQFHEDRLINSHIGYIDRFRLYLLNENIDWSIGTKSKVNNNCAIT